MFFESAQNLNVLKDFINRTEHFSFTNRVSQMRLENSRKIVDEIANLPGTWDTFCGFNVHHLGERFIDDLRNFSVSDKDKEQINRIYTRAFRFLCELDFTSPVNFELEIIKNEILNDAINNESEVRSQIIYASYMMPAHIVKSLFEHEKFEVISDFSAKLDNAEKLREDWDRELTAKHKSVEALGEKIDGIKTGFNFVGLYKGFGDLSNKKADELNLLFLSLTGMSVLILAPLVYEFFQFSVFSGEAGFQIAELLKLIPLVSMELIFIYFFRIILMNYRSTKAQIMQIELRQTLCQFIQSYAEYASEIKSKDATSLEKFEHLIFSGIVSDTEKLPSTFDGLEQIGKLLKNVKGT